MADYASITFSQRDPAWKDKHIGGTGLTMGEAGCAITACAVIACRACKKILTPLNLLMYLNAFGGFNKYGQIYWVKVAEFINKNGGKTAFTLNPFGTRYWVRAVWWGTFEHFVNVKPGGLCINPWNGKVELMNQSKWKPTLKYRYFR